MNPIRLSAPDGRVYAYACGVCHNIPAGGFHLGPWPADGPHDGAPERSHDMAEECCTCRSCGAGPVALMGCDPCNLKRSQRWMWSVIATCMKHGLTTREEYDAWCDDDDEDDDDDDSDEGSP